MEPDRAKKVGDADAELEQAASAERNEGASVQNSEHVEQMPAAESASPKPQTDVTTPTADQDGVLLDESLPANQLFIEPLSLPPEPPPFGREIQLPLPAQVDDERLSDEDDMTFDEAVQHFVTLAENKMRELNLGQQDSAMGTKAAPSAGDIAGGSADARGKPEADGGAPRLRHPSDARAADRESTGFDRRAGSPPGLATSAGDAAGEEGAVRVGPLQVFVHVADARARYDEAIDAALTRNVPKFQDIAQTEVKLGFWWHENERRAADPSLRGPV